MVAEQGARIIGINMGCPAKTVTGGLSGSALMRDLDHAQRMIEAVTGGVDVPVTLKMRLGLDANGINAPTLAALAQATGVAQVTVHSRTRAQFYEARDDWNAIAAVKRAVRIPVIANGDIRNLAGVHEALDASGAVGLMNGRATRGRPWIVGRLAAMLCGDSPARPLEGQELCDLIVEHYESILLHYGTSVGLRIARKQPLGYLDGLHAGAALKPLVHRLESPSAVIRALRDGLTDCGTNLEAAA